MEVLSRHITAALSGSRDAREEVARRASTLALRTATAVLGDREAAGDIAQDVTVQVLRKLGRLREPAAFDGWVQRITVRETLRAARRQRVRVGRERPVEVLPEPGAGTGDDQAALQAVLSVALAELPAKQRVAVVLKYVHDLTEAEIADALGCAPGTAASLLSRGRAHLRKHPELSAFHRSEGVIK
ncbi:MAG: hypothetical protein QOJ29_2839 [Thermoleophilaceae bacterium]|jgi:RNA polymerase sigma-70 factor (ECF subfamily)|nr:hypothetical protein [Thermoleophilaceae bacterium]